MCGRYEISSDPRVIAARWQAGFDAAAPQRAAPRLDVRPTQDVPVIALDRDGARKLVMMRWGLVPPWTKPGDDGRPEPVKLSTINARADKLQDSKLYGPAFTKGHRCLIAADAFFEWTGEKGHKTKHRIRPTPSNRLARLPFAMAGLWSSWRPKGSDAAPLLSCTIITVPAPAADSAAGAYAGIHDRMPAILPDDAVALWLGETASSEAELADLLQPWGGALEVSPPSPISAGATE